jgi:hypothetical protein
MIDARNGRITIGPLVITRDLRRDDFVRSVYFDSGEITNSRQDWYTASAKRQHENGAAFAVNLLFRGQTLAAVYVVRTDAFGGDWSHWSEEIESARQVAHDALLDYDLGSKREFEWGRAESVFDPKGGGSLIVVEYE